MCGKQGYSYVMSEKIKAMEDLELGRLFKLNNAYILENVWVQIRFNLYMPHFIHTYKWNILYTL